ncbi:Epsin-3, clathrin recruitment and traffic between the Golgi and endosome [Basidiobolus ranarum]|uniref:Epsin-3, clathrin recruitment and traffic between the Golgi and endosome n=1 Tax=Basidiobolus ranarum TaxID=34480 RepID=A0ABR2WM47_9FUNG
MNSFNSINSLWDIKEVITKVKNVVYNYTEMEAKVREATNNDAWGASGTLMQEIAQGTYNFQYFNEIMGTIYKRFTEKEAKDWRQIYKALSLLEYLIKNGSEKVIDDARGHMSMIKMFRSFHYIDEKNKDQGINVRTRAKLIVDLLGSSENIKEERKKAKANKNKYTGVSNETADFGGDSGSRYGGFGSDSGFGGGSDGGRSRYKGFGSESGSGGGNRSRYGGFGSDSYSNSSNSNYQSQSHSGAFNDDDDDEDVAVNYDNDNSYTSKSTKRKSSLKTTSEPKENVDNKEQIPTMDLFSFDEPAPASSTVDDEWGTFQTTADDDDFGDFQATPQSSKNQIPVLTSTAPLAPISAPQTSNKQNGSGNSSTATNLLDFDFFSEDIPVNNNKPSSNQISANPVNLLPTSSKPLSALNQSSFQSTPQAKKDNLTNQFSGMKVDDIWGKHGGLVSLDNLGQKDQPKRSNGPSMNTLATTNAPIWGNSNSTNKSFTPLNKDDFDSLI